MVNYNIINKLGKTSDLFKEMTNAYELLSTPDKRKQYDDYRFYSGDSANSHGSNQSNSHSTSNSGGFSGKGPYQNFWNGNDYAKWSQQRENKVNQNYSYENRSEKIKYTYRDPRTGQYKTEYRNAGEGNPFFKDFEEILKRMKENHEQEERNRNQQDSKFANNYWSRNQKYYDNFYTKNPNSRQDEFENPNNFRYGGGFRHTNSTEERAVRWLKYFFYFSMFFFLYMFLVANARRRQALYEMQGRNQLQGYPNNQPYQPEYNQYNQQSFQPINIRMKNDDPYLMAKPTQGTIDPYIQNQSKRAYHGDPYLEGGSKYK